MDAHQSHSAIIRTEDTVWNYQDGHSVHIVHEYRADGCITWREA